jgi:hypothetical protein
LALLTDIISVGALNNIFLAKFASSIKSEPTGIEFVDSTSIKVCHNLRINRHKTLVKLPCRGKGTMGWFYGFKLHL